MKRCLRCNIEKEYSEFFKRKASKDGYTIYCKSCINKYTDEHKNDESVIKYRKEYQSKYRLSINKESMRIYKNVYEKERCKMILTIS
jgi:hypothetical protein